MTEAIIKFKNRHLSKNEIEEIENYLSAPTAVKSEYVTELYTITLNQIIKKAGFTTASFNALENYKKNRLEFLAERLTRHILKRKLKKIVIPQKIPELDPNLEILDPHFHFNSMRIKEKPELLALLPDFSQIYVELQSCRTNEEAYEKTLLSQKGILTDTQFIIRGPKKYQNSNKEQRINPTIGYIRQKGNEGITSHASCNSEKVCNSCDMCGLETQDSLKDLEKYLQLTVRHKAKIIRIHIGETHVPEDGKNNVIQLIKLLKEKKEKGEITDQVIRLGHGTHMDIQSMKDCAEQGYYVEACLSSNKETAIIGKRSEYPLPLMLLLGVKVVIGTDGGDLYYTNLHQEYAYASKNINHFLSRINEGKPEIVQLVYGDKLQYKQIKELFKSTVVASTWTDDKEITFADLKLIESQCMQNINIFHVIKNMNELKQILFPLAKQESELADTPIQLPLKKNVSITKEEKPSNNYTKLLILSGVMILGGIVIILAAFMFLGLSTLATKGIAVATVGVTSTLLGLGLFKLSMDKNNYLKQSVNLPTMPEQPTLPSQNLI